MFLLIRLRSVFDMVCETVAFARGVQGDLSHLALTASDAVVCLGSAGFTWLALFAVVLAGSTSPRSGGPR